LSCFLPIFGSLTEKSFNFCSPTEKSFPRLCNC